MTNPNIPLQVSRVMFQKDGTATIEGTLTLEHPVTLISEHFVLPKDAVVTNVSVGPADPSVMTVQDTPRRFTSLLDDVKKETE